MRAVFLAAQAHAGVMLAIERSRWAFGEPLAAGALRTPHPAGVRP